MGTIDLRTEIRDFLSTRRARITPEQAGLPAYGAPQSEIRISVKAVAPGQYQTPAGTVNTRRYSIVFNNPSGPLDAELTVDDRGRFARLDIPAATLVISRQDLASVATRTQSSSSRSALCPRCATR